MTNATQQPVLYTHELNSSILHPPTPQYRGREVNGTQSICGHTLIRQHDRQRFAPAQSCASYQAAAGLDMIRHAIVVDFRDGKHCSY
jgi:hypothetical protein